MEETMHHDSPLTHKIFATVALSIYVIASSIVYYPVALYNLLNEVLTYVWGDEQKKVTSNETVRT